MLFAIICFLVNNTLAFQSAEPITKVLYFAQELTFYS